MPPVICHSGKWEHDQMACSTWAVFFPSGVLNRIFFPGPLHLRWSGGRGKSSKLCFGCLYCLLVYFVYRLLFIYSKFWGCRGVPASQELINHGSFDNKLRKQLYEDVNI